MAEGEFIVNEELLDLISHCHDTVQSYINHMEQKIILQQKIISSLILDRRLNSHDIGIQTAVDGEETSLEPMQQHAGIQELESSSVLEDIKQLSDEASQIGEQFLYEETSGLYYDTISGYYYDAVRCLYYDGNGTYLSYNYDTQAYEVAVFQEEEKAVRPKRTAKRRSKPKDETAEKKENTETEDKTHDEEQREEGEISEVSEEESEDTESPLASPRGDTEQQVVSSIDAQCYDFYRLAIGQPPCIRIVVQQCQSNHKMTGMFFIVPYTGGGIGRGTQNLVSLEDESLEDVHANIFYDEDEKLYRITNIANSDIVLNGKVLSTTEPTAILVHGSRLQVGSSTLLLHIHRGTETCGHCEPGLIKVKEEEPKPDITEKKGLRQNQMRKEMRKIKEKYGIQKPIKSLEIAEGYEDKAAARRKKHGIDYVNAKAEVSSVDQQINKSNKGFKMLAKMGWSSGEGIGKNQGIAEPIAVDGRTGTAGLGSAAAFPAVEVTFKQKRKRENLEKTKQRFDKLPEKIPDADGQPEVSSNIE